MSLDFIFFGQNDQKLHGNYKIYIFGAKQLGRGMGGQASLVSGRNSPSPSTMGNHCVCVGVAAGVGKRF